MLCSEEDSCKIHTNVLPEYSVAYPSRRHSSHFIAVIVCILQTTCY